MTRVRRAADGGGWVIFCPACQAHHTLGPGWHFDGDQERPTFSPSVLVEGHLGGGQYGRCHSLVRDGKIEFLSDCTHASAGKTAELPHFQTE